MQYSSYPYNIYYLCEGDYITYIIYHMCILYVYIYIYYYMVI